MELVLSTFSFKELGFKHHLAFNEGSRGTDVASRSFTAGVTFVQRSQPE